VALHLASTGVPVPVTYPCRRSSILKPRSTLVSCPLLSLSPLIIKQEADYFSKIAGTASWCSNTRCHLTITGKPSPNPERLLLCQMSAKANATNDNRDDGNISLSPTCCGSNNVFPFVFVQVSFCGPYPKNFFA